MEGEKFAHKVKGGCFLLSDHDDHYRKLDTSESHLSQSTQFLLTADRD
jgi:hypothetical protein